MEALHQRHADQLTQLRTAMGLDAAEANLSRIADLARQAMADIEAGREYLPADSVNDDDWHLVAEDGEVLDVMPASTFRRMGFSAWKLPPAEKGEQWVRGLSAKHMRLWRSA